MELWPLAGRDSVTSASSGAIFSKRVPATTRCAASMSAKSPCCTLQSDANRGTKEPDHFRSVSLACVVLLVPMMLAPSLRSWNVEGMNPDGTAGPASGPSVIVGDRRPDRSAADTHDSSPLANDPFAVHARLSDAAETGTVLELVVVLRGTVHPWGDARDGLWRVRLPGGHHRLFAADAVIAATPVKNGNALARAVPAARTEK